MPLLINGSSRAETRESVLSRQKLKQTRQYRKASVKENAALLEWTTPIQAGLVDGLLRREIVCFREVVPLLVT